MSDDDTPTDEERAKFLMEEATWLVGYRDAIEMGLNNEYPTDTDRFVENLYRELTEGIQSQMQNRREIGASPIHAWEYHIKEEWPDWFVRELAEMEHTVFTGGFIEDRPQEEREYIEYLEDEYEVPR